MQEDAIRITTVTESPPDWSTISREILCPLCDYNLRGLIEPRCPECGHQFKWSEVLLQGDRVHPFLFEHQPHRPYWSFLKTLALSQIPTRFWKTVLPIHAPVTRRLVLYWFIVSSALVLELGSPYLGGVANYYRNIHQLRQQRSQVLQSVRAQWKPMNKANADAEAAGVYPYRMPWEVRVIVDNRLSPRLLAGGHLCLVLMLWSPLTVASLMIFRQTLRQARIRTIHVVRCAVYTGDASLIWGWPLALMLSLTIDPLTGHTFVFFTPFFLVVWAGLVALFTWRLSRAYRYYLRFPRPVWTCLASQVIVALALLAIMPWVIMF